LLREKKADKVKLRGWDYGFSGGWRSDLPISLHIINLNCKCIGWYQWRQAWKCPICKWKLR